MRLAIGFVVVAVLFSCRPKAQEPLSIVKSENDTPRTRALAALKESLTACVEQKFEIPALSQEQQSRLLAIYDEFAGNECAGCHYAAYSYGSTGNFTVSQQAGPPEFFKGLALRHFLTREIATACFEDGPAKEYLLGRLTAMRIATDGTGRLFFQPGTEEEMRAMTMSFLQGGFEVPNRPGEAPHEVVYVWIKSGGRFAKETHVDILMDVIALNGLFRDEPGRWQALEPRRALGTP